MRKFVLSIITAAGLALGLNGAEAAPILSQTATAASAEHALPVDQVRYRRHAVAPRRAGPRVVYRTVYRTRYVYARPHVPKRRPVVRYYAPEPVYDAPDYYPPAVYAPAPAYVPPQAYPETVYAPPVYSGPAYGGTAYVPPVVSPGWSGGRSYGGGHARGGRVAPVPGQTVATPWGGGTHRRF